MAGSLEDYNREITYIAMLPFSEQRWWMKKALERGPDFVIGPSDDPYMLRWWVIPRNPVFNIYLHCFLRSDSDEALHDHPWVNASFLLRGTYLEHTIEAGGVNKVRRFNAGDWTARRSIQAHRVELDQGPAWSCFITGPKIRKWGFHCPKGWKPWEKFVDIRDGGNQRGIGCGEP